MANFGNAWHIPNNPEPRGRGGMRDPIGAIVTGTAVTIISGNQFQGTGNPGNQLQVGSTLFFKKKTDPTWVSLPLLFLRALGNNKYFSATIPGGTFQTGDVVQYYLRISYDDHDTTFLHTDGDISTPTADEAAAQGEPFSFPIEDNAVKGQWGSVFQLPNVAIHAHMLPNGRILMWGRRDHPDDLLDAHECTPFVWSPKDRTTVNTPQPTLSDGTTKVNLFCSGHAFLPDGRLLVVGGHLADSNGVNQAALYNSAENTWTPTALMNRGRWYPTATALPDGSVLVAAGSYQENGVTVHNTVPQVWKNNTWTSITPFTGTNSTSTRGVLELYPRMHVESDGQVFMSGPLEQTYRLRVSNGGQWTAVSPRALKQRDYCPSVMYDINKVVYIGGGGGHDSDPAAETEIIDLSESLPRWRQTNPMRFRRRQHNGTLLPDGTVLVTGGTRNDGGPSDGFNDLSPGQPVHTAELWDPATGKWTTLAAETVDRCYHSTALLLPDATVLSAGGGEYRPFGGLDAPPNDSEDSHRDGQIFSPPYVFKGTRPQITSDPPASIHYGDRFDLDTPQSNDISKVSWVRLGSVTHSFDQNQRIVFLECTKGVGKLTVSAPKSSTVCPPGHYMMFILNGKGVPSIAKIVQIHAAATQQPPPGVVPVMAAEAQPTAPSLLTSDVSPQEIYAQQTQIVEEAKGTAVIVGISGTCPYGIAACWGGASEALHRLEGVEMVNPVPDAQASTAKLFLVDDRLPALDKWDELFRSIVNGRYKLRGVEVVLQGTIKQRNGKLFLVRREDRPPVLLTRLLAPDKIQWSQTTREQKPLEEDEANAYDKLAVTIQNLPDSQEVTITGPLKQIGTEYELHVRLFILESVNSNSAVRSEDTVWAR